MVAPVGDCSTRRKRSEEGSEAPISSGGTLLVLHRPMKKSPEPNQSLEPTSTSVTSAADAPAAPLALAAHL